MRVLVLDGNENQAVAAARGLAAANYHVAVGSDSRWSKAGWSRACAETFAYPAPDRDAGAFVASIAATAAAAPGTLVLPMTERTTLPLSEARRMIDAARGRLVLPPHETVLRAFDKEQTTNLARRLGIRVPATATVASDADAEQLASHLPYPVVVKPRSSQELVAGAVRTTGGPIYARDPEEFRGAWAALSRRCSCALVQEFVAGTGTGYFALMRDGEARAEFAHRRLRDVRPTGSGSAVRESIAPPPRVREAALAILSALNWHGVAMVEFRVQPDGTPVFLEVNGRFWNSLALAVHAGVNFPALVARLAADGDVEPVNRYRVGVRCRWFLGDVRHLVEVWRGAPAAYPGVFPSRLETLAAVLAPVAGTYHDNFAWHDPMPELGDWLYFLLRQLPQRTAAARVARGWHAARRPSPS